MATGTAPLVDRRDAVSGCAEALRGLHQVLYQCGNGDLAGLAGDLAELRALCAAGLAQVTAEAVARGVIQESQCASTAAWITDMAWHSRREATTLAKTATILTRPDLADVADAIRDVDIDPATAATIAAEYDKLAPDLRDEAKPAVLDQLLTVGAEHGPAGVRRLKQQILARYGQPGDFDDHQERCRRHIDLTAGRETTPGLWDYRLTLDNEGRAVLEAAIGPLSAPAPAPDTGQPDPRPVGRRRGEALIAALARSVTAAGHVPTSPKAVLILTMDFHDLAGRVRANRVGAATTLGPRGAGIPLAPDTIRKLACDAGVIPTVLATDGAILDQGREQRLFTTTQIRALWLRDRHCTFDGCTAPAGWCDAHHLTHWIDGGPTDLTNAALLCPRHHTIVHRDHLAGETTATGVTWNPHPNSYRPPPATIPPVAAPPPPPPPEVSPPDLRSTPEVRPPWHVTPHRSTVARQ